VSATRRVVSFVDERTGAVPLVRRSLRFVFPDHWSFLLGEVALYSFVVLLGTGVFLTFFFDDSTAQTIYNGDYAPLVGHEMSSAYRSVVDISISVKAGLLIRQTHHWAANVFIAAIVLHLARILFTGAFRKPRDLTYYIGVTMLMLALLEGYIGYSLGDDLLSGMGLAIGYSVALSIPFVGANLAALIWGGPFPGDPTFWSRMYVTHILLIPATLAVLIGLHLVLVASRHHTQFRMTRRHTERTVVGTPLIPGYAPRSLGLASSVVAMLFLLGGLVQINPIWLWGPYHVSEATNGAQPDWYLGWLIGGLRLMPDWDLVIGGYTVVPNPFWGGAAFPLVVFAILFSWPWLERRLTGDHGFHNLLDRPRDSPWRTALAAALATWVVFVFLAGAMDRAQVTFGLSYEKQLWAFRVLVWVVPALVLLATLRICRELRAGDDVLFRRRTAERAARLDV